MKKHLHRRILITPNVSAPYDQRMVNGLATGFRTIGQDARATSEPVSPESLLKLVNKYDVDTVIQVNRTRSLEFCLPNHVRHIAWFQDIFPQTLDRFTEKFRDSDILYTLGDPEMLGLNVEVKCRVGTLFTGVEMNACNFNTRDFVQDIDLSLCGALPPPILRHGMALDRLLAHWIDRILETIPLLSGTDLFSECWKRLSSKDNRIPTFSTSEMVEIEKIIEETYDPLTGSLDIHYLANCLLNKSSGIKRAIRNANKTHIFFKAKRKNKKQAYMQAAKALIDYYTQSYPRVMDRKLLVYLASRTSGSLSLYGNGLDRYSFAAPYYKGVIDCLDQLLQIYRRSKINLHNNTHGLGLHSRTLECMAVGGFIFAHRSPRDHKPGGMLTCFEPGVHYGAYSPENFQEEAERWLRDNKRRIEVGKNAKSVVLASHCWHHRAKQILGDLET